MYIYIYIYIANLISIYSQYIQLLYNCLPIYFLTISRILDHIISVLTSINNTNHIFIKLISDYYKNMNLYILMLKSLL